MVVPQKSATTALLATHQYWLLSCIGALLIGVTMPTLLASWNMGFNGKMTGGFLPDPEANTAKLEQTVLNALQNIASLEFAAMIFCGPLALVFAFLLYLTLRGKKYEQHTLRSLVIAGMIGGVACAYMNLPGYFAAALLDWSKLFVAAVQLIMLFAVAGATSGAWIAWQAYRRNHPEAGFIPPYRLSSLLALVLAWGFLLALFSVH
jgi:hypothetical protein